MKKDIRNIFIGLLFGIGSLYAIAAVSVPNTFTAGTSIKSADVNANFSALATGVNALETSKQSRVTGTCAAGQAIKEVKTDGTVTCEAVVAGGISSVTTNSSLTGTGAAATPLGVANSAVTAAMLQTTSAPVGTKFLSFNGTGLAWADGSSGTAGPQGPQGIQGPAGATGATGATGPAGAGVSFGQTLTGSSGIGLKINNTSTTPLDYGLEVHAQSGNAIYGITTSTLTGASGVQGTNGNPDGIGVFGASGGTGVKGQGVTGVYGIGTQVGVSATGTTTALLVDGPIKVTGTNKAAFIHTATAASITANRTCINNVATNNNPNAIVIITQHYSGVYNGSPTNVIYYNAGWCISNSDGLTPMPVGILFNVLVINQ